MPKLWGMRSTPSIPSFSGPLRPREVALGVLSMGQIDPILHVTVYKQKNCELTLN